MGKRIVCMLKGSLLSRASFFRIVKVHAVRGGECLNFPEDTYHK